MVEQKKDQVTNNPSGVSIREVPYFEDVLRGREQALVGLETGSLDKARVYFGDLKTVIEDHLEGVIRRTGPAPVEEAWLMQITQALIANYLEDSEKATSFGLTPEALNMRQLGVALLRFPGVAHEVETKQLGYTQKVDVTIKVFNSRLRKMWEDGKFMLGHWIGDGLDPELPARSKMSPEELAEHHKRLNV